MTTAAASVLPDGWLTDREADELRRLAAGRTVLELGAWKGRSTVCLAETARYVVSVDRHRGIPGYAPGDTLRPYLKAVRGLSNVAIVIADFADVVPHLARFDLVFVDGDHAEESVARDARLARIVAPTVAFHDWHLDRVRRGASILDRDPDYVTDSLAVFT